MNLTQRLAALKAAAPTVVVTQSKPVTVDSLHEALSKLQTAAPKAQTQTAQAKAQPKADSPEERHTPAVAQAVAPVVPQVVAPQVVATTTQATPATPALSALDKIKALRAQQALASKPVAQAVDSPEVREAQVVPKVTPKVTPTPVAPTVQVAPVVAPTAQPLATTQSLKERLAAMRAASASASASLEPTVARTESLAHKLNAEAQQRKQQAMAIEQATNQRTDADAFSFNEEQLAAIELAQIGKSFCLIGAAGTGKTTAVREIVRQALIAHGYDNTGADPIALVSFTNRAVRNIRKAISGITETKIRDRGLANCKTIHKLLEFSPKYYDIEVPREGGKGFTMKQTMRFEPTYNMYNPMEHYKLIIIDESSMLGLALFKQLVEACPNAHFIFIGDLNQLKPVMDDSVLGFKLGELPVIELTRVYRQALESPIVGFQHKFTLAGKLLGDSSLAKLTAESNGQLVFQPITQNREPEVLAKVFANAMLKHMDNGEYTPCVDAILIPNYKNFGSYWVSLWIAQELGKRRDAVVHEVRAVQHPISESPMRYFAIGDFVIHAKEEYFIADIRPNAAYTGRTLQAPSRDITRIGSYTSGNKAVTQDFESVLWEVEQEVEQREVCSHFITLVPASGCSNLEDAQNNLSIECVAVTLNSRKDVGDLEFGYAITIHKSQGSEWRKVFLAVATHARNMRTRELLYTAMTRAKEQLHIYYSPDSAMGANDNGIARCIRNQEIKGKTWREKVETFNLKRAEYETFMLEPTVYGV